MKTKKLSKKYIKLLIKIQKAEKIYRDYRWKTDHLYLKYHPYIEYIKRSDIDLLIYNGYLMYNTFFLTDKAYEIIEPLNNEVIKIVQIHCPQCNIKRTRTRENKNWICLNCGYEIKFFNEKRN